MPSGDTSRAARSGLHGFLAALATSVILIFASEPRASEVDLELVLAVDASSSVEWDEFRLQMRGIAEAFRDAGVIAAIETAAPNGLAVSLVQWSGVGRFVQAVDWAVVDGEATSRAFAAAVDDAPRLVQGGPTAIGAAIADAARLIQGNVYEGRRRVIDISGDGTTNEGEMPPFVRARVLRAGFTINGLAILNEEPRLDRHYRMGVIGGPGAFLLTADDYDDFARAIRLKLIKEISGPPVALLPHDDLKAGGGQSTMISAAPSGQPVP